MFPYTKELVYQSFKFKVIINNEIENDFWRRYETDQWEPDVMKFYLNNVTEGYFLDVGSWIGPVSIPMSFLYEKVISVDFDPIAKKHFAQNIEVNGIQNIHPINIGLSDRKQKYKLDESWFGSSETSLFHADNREGVEVDLITFLDLIKKIPDSYKISFIKIDIEGGEFKILDDVYKFMNRQKVMVLLSYHPFHLKPKQWMWFKRLHALKQLRFTKYIFKEDGSIQKIKPFDFLSILKYRFPIGDVIAS